MYEICLNYLSFRKLPVIVHAHLFKCFNASWPFGHSIKFNLKNQCCIRWNLPSAKGMNFNSLTYMKIMVKCLFTNSHDSIMIVLFHICKNCFLNISLEHFSHMFSKQVSSKDLGDHYFLIKFKYRSCNFNNILQHYTRKS